MRDAGRLSPYTRRREGSAEGAGLVVVGSGARVVGLDINANHLRAVRDGWVTGTARPLHIGRTTQVWEIRLENDAGELSCIARLTMAVVQKAP